MWFTSVRAPARSVRAVLMFCAALFSTTWLPGHPAGSRLMTDADTPESDVRDALTLLVRSLRSACACALTVAETDELSMRCLQFGDEGLERAVDLGDAVRRDDLVDLRILEDIDAVVRDDEHAVGVRLGPGRVALDRRVERGESVLIGRDLPLELRLISPGEPRRILDEGVVGAKGAEATLHCGIAPRFQRSQGDGVRRRA